MRSALLALAAGAALLAGCGGSESAGRAAPVPSDAPASSQAAAPPASGDVRVVMEDYEFVPREVTVEAGETVTWVNEGEAQHNAVATEGDGPESELFNPGGSYSWTAGRAATIPYVCTIHPGMEGTITVR